MLESLLIKLQATFFYITPLLAASVNWNIEKSTILYSEGLKGETKRLNMKNTRHVGMWTRRHARHVGTWAREPVRHVGTWARRHAKHVSTWARKARNLANSENILLYRKNFHADEIFEESSFFMIQHLKKYCIRKECRDKTWFEVFNLHNCQINSCDLLILIT